MRLTWLLSLALAVCACVGTAQAQPLVTNGLVAYYSFDGNFGETVTDGSGNHLDGQVLGNVIPDTNSKRGGGAAFFAPDATGDAPNFGAAVVNITANKASVPNFTSLTPKEAFSFSAWVNVSKLNNSGSILQARSDQGSFVSHIQLEGSGALRFTLRGDVQDASAPNGGTIANKNPAFLDNVSQQYPLNEWFQFAGTYESSGIYHLYYNGEEFFTDAGFGGNLGNWNGCDGVTAGTGTNRCEVGDIPSGALIGAVSDGGGRRFEGLMDEFYVFNRVLSDSEVKALYDLTPVGKATDLNSDGAVDAADAGLMFADWGGPGSTSSADFNKDGFVDAADAGTMFADWTGDPAAPGANAATAEYNYETGELKVSSAGAVNLFVQSAGSHITPLNPAPAVPVGLLTNNASRVGITNLGPINVSNFSFGNIGAGLAKSDLKLVYTPALGQKGIEVGADTAGFKYIPEPASFGMIGLGLAGLLAARRRG